MNSLNTDVLASVRQRLGRDFQHHYKPENLCRSGRVTRDECMKRGLDDVNGYDCSGLVIASLCEVVGITTDMWPRKFRHTRQLLSISEEAPAHPGDLRLFTFTNGNIHLGIAATENTLVHASGISCRVEEGELTVRGETLDMERRVAIESLYQVVTRGRSEGTTT